jgi:RNase H-fold protein (predicted Holliday junction resolvase)
MNSMQQEEYYLGIDPGRQKCGLALITGTKRTVLLNVCVLKDLAASVSRIVEISPGLVFLLGDGTGHRGVRSVLEEGFPGVPLKLVDELKTSEEARELFFRDNPPRGLKRLVPRGLLTTGEMIDAYAAKAIVFRYLTGIKKDGNGV